MYEDDDDRIVVEKVPNGNILSIRLAEEDDAGAYTCQVSAAETIELVHNVEIRGDGKLKQTKMENSFLCF